MTRRQAARQDDQPALPTIDIKRMVKDQGGVGRIASEMTYRIGIDGWELKTLQKRVRVNSMSVQRLLELMHFARLHGRHLKVEDYITWNNPQQYPPAPPPEDIPQPVPVRQ